MKTPILGYHVVDRVTGFKGVAVGHVEYITGCNQTLVVPQVGTDGKMPEGSWIDDQRLQLSEGEPVQLPISTSNGHDAAPPRSY